jgi:hypothetical protein
MGMSRTVAGMFINRFETLLADMMDEVIHFPSQDQVQPWNDLVRGFEERGCDFPDVACVFDGTIINTQRPRDFQVSLILSIEFSSNCIESYTLD